MYKLLFFAHDPGGANAVAPLIEPLTLKGHKVFIYAKGPAILKLPGSIEMTQSPEELLQEIKPDFLVTGTSANDFTEKYLWDEAKKLSTKSLAILDHWFNYGIRFSKYGLNNLELYNQNRTFDYLPDYICVMDDYAKEQMQKEGVPPEIILPLGNPHFQNLINISKNVDYKNIREKFLKNRKKKLITFASEPYIEDYGRGKEKLALEHLLEITQNTGMQVLVKLHPKENFEKYQDYNVVMDKETSPMEVILASDIVISMTSMFLIESLILEKTTVSYQPGETDKNKFILTKMNALPFINSKEEFSQEIDKVLLNEFNLKYNFSINPNAIECIIDFLEKNLCLN